MIEFQMSQYALPVVPGYVETSKIPPNWRVILQRVQRMEAADKYRQQQMKKPVIAKREMAAALWAQPRVKSVWHGEKDVYAFKKRATKSFIKLDVQEEDNDE